MLESIDVMTFSFVYNSKSIELKEATVATLATVVFFSWLKEGIMSGSKRNDT